MAPVKIMNNIYWLARILTNPYLWRSDFGRFVRYVEMLGQTPTSPAIPPIANEFVRSNGVDRIAENLCSELGRGREALR